MGMLSDKLKNLYGKISECGAEVAVIESDFLRRYLTDFYSTDGYVLLEKDGCTVVADPRYFEAAKRKFRSGRIRVVEGAIREVFELLKGYTKIGLPYAFITAASLRRFEEKGFETVDVSAALRGAMLVKEAWEMDRIARACDIAEAAFNELLGDIKEGMTETDVAAILEYYMRAFGASGTSFDTICAFGANASMPHYETGMRKLRFGDPVLIDFGCKYEGYCSDITRTFLFGDDKYHEDFKKVHSIVLLAHELAKERITSGMTGRQADAIARNYLESKGLGGMFTHSLGHGVGLQIHEAPNLSPRSEDVLEDGMVFSIEPGVYLPGEMGVRIEDTVLLADGRVRSFMSETSRKALIIL